MPDRGFHGQGRKAWPGGGHRERGQKRPPGGPVRPLLGQAAHPQLPAAYRETDGHGERRRKPGGDAEAH